MKICIDISQIVYEGAGVASYVKHLTTTLIHEDKKNSYILFGASFRQRKRFYEFYKSFKDIPNVRLYILPIPVRLLEFVWNTLGIIPISWIIGPVDVVWSSDWVQPPLGGAIGVTTIHDVSFLHYPETFSKVIVQVQNRRLKRVVKYCAKIFCDSLATKDDIKRLLHISDNKLTVIYPGFT